MNKTEAEMLLKNGLGEQFAEVSKNFTCPLFWGVPEIKGIIGVGVELM